ASGRVCQTRADQGFRKGRSSRPPSAVLGYPGRRRRESHDRSRHHYIDVVKIRVESPHLTEKRLGGAAIAQFTEQLARDTENASAGRYAHGAVSPVARVPMNVV